MKILKKLIWCLLSCFFFNGLYAQEARLLRFPAVYGNQVVFSYAGDLYTVSRGGGTARKLTNDPGYEMFPHFSHDGKQIAFTAQYDGNTEVYVMPAQGGQPKRITYTATLGRDDVSDRMGPNNIVMGWTPDDKWVIYRGRGTSFNPFKGKLYKAPISGDLSEELPFSVAGWCSYNADGSKLAMNRVFREFRTWKYYRGGMADDIWIYDTKSGTSENVTNNLAQDIFPMYYKNLIYYFSDRDHTMNLFEYNTQTKQTRKVTNFDTYDCKFPSLGNDAIAFENAGYIYLYDLKTNKTEKVNVQFDEDMSAGRSRQIDASKFVENFSLSPDGKRALFSARGDIFTVPAKSGVTRNLTHSSGAHDRNPTWSPDGKWIGFISDRTGEDELYIQVQDGSAPARQVTKGGGSYKFEPVWSPDSKMLLLSDQANDLYYIYISTGAKTIVTHSDDGQLQEYNWSPDNKWITYTQPGAARRFGVVRLYNIDTKKNIAVTDEWYNSRNSFFSPDGKWLYFVSDRDFNPIYSRTEWNHAYADMSRPYMVRLSDSTVSNFQIEDDEVAITDDNKAAPAKENIKKDGSVNVVVDEAGLSDRIESLPVVPGMYFISAFSSSGLYYLFMSSHSPVPVFKYFDLKDKKETDLGIPFGIVSSNQKKVLFNRGDNYYIEDLGKTKIDAKNKLNLDGLKTYTDLHAEWKQIFNESWRQMRDFFFDPNMRGIDWKAMHDKYAVLLPYVNHRNDLTYIIGEMVGELSLGHTYVSGGDRPEVKRIPMGLLGAIFSRDKSGYYKIDSILPGESWDKKLTSPLRAPGVAAKKGDFIIAINCEDVSRLSNLYQPLIGKAGQVVEIRLNTEPDAAGAKKYYVKPIADESPLYYYGWVQQNIAKVTKASGGKIGYLHIPDMGVEGLNQFARYFYPQLDKEALIIDDRGNGGGNVSPMIIERLRREPGLGTMSRNDKTAGLKPDAQVGPKVALIDQYSASDGDLFAYQFKFYKIGSLIGQRTWGGVVGIGPTLPFIDGGDLRKPGFAHFAADGSRFIIEGHGVDPDIEVVNDPHQEWLGNDTQLKRAIDEMLKKLKEPGQKGVPPIPPIPPYREK